MGDVANKARLLVVEDDAPMRAGISIGLREAGYEVRVSVDGAAAVERILDEAFDLVVLDLMLPERDGFEVLAALSGRSSVPVIVLTARTDVDSRVRSFDLGAVDYLPKPFFIRELVARVEARIGRRGSPDKTVTWADVVLDLDARTIRRGDEPIVLTAHELNILAYLATRRGRALTRSYIAEGALPEGGSRADRTVDSHVSRIRSKLGEPAAAAIRTVWGIGYRFDLPESP